MIATKRGPGQGLFETFVEKTGHPSLHGFEKEPWGSDPGPKLNDSNRRLGVLVADTVSGLGLFSGFFRFPSENGHGGGCFNLPQIVSSWIAHVDTVVLSCISTSSSIKSKDYVIWTYKAETINWKSTLVSEDLSESNLLGKGYTFFSKERKCIEVQWVKFLGHIRKSLTGGDSAICFITCEWSVIGPSYHGKSKRKLLSTA